MDIEQDPTTQGFAEGQFDLVLAANVVHATQDLTETMHNIRRLLVPGGLVVLLEGARPQRWLDLIFGLTDGWWRFTDTDLRPSNPLIGPEQWLQLMGQCGYQSAVALPQESAADLAKKNQSPAPHVVVVAQNTAELPDSEISSTGQKQPGWRTCRHVACSRRSRWCRFRSRFSD